MSLLDKLIIPSLLLCIPAVLTYQVFYVDYEAYWSACPVPFHWFLVVQTHALIFIAVLMRVKSSAYRRFVFFASLCLFLTVVVGTIKGLSWYKELTTTTEDDGFNNNLTFKLKTEYYIAALILLAIPIVVAVFFVILMVVLIIVLIVEFRRNRSRFRYNPDDELGLQVNAEEVAETYMRLLEHVTYN